jgi:hypothetical protein
MAFSFGSNIVTNGLVFYADAGNTKSYLGSGSTWIDLSGQGSNATLVNTPTYNSSNLGYFTLNGTTQYFQCSPNSNFNFGTGDNAIEAWIYWDGTYTNTGRVIYATGSSGSLDQLGIFSGFGMSYAGISQNIAANYPTVNGWSHVVGTRIGTSVSIYVNNVQSATGTQAGAIGSSVAIPYIGYRGADAQHPFSGRISMIKVYKNKGLTAKEVSQNFNAHRGRYGI